MVRVRIKDHDRRPDLSIGVVVGAAVCVWFAIVLWFHESSVVAVQRDLTHVRVTYLCNAGHSFEGFADIRSRACSESQCRERAWVVWSYQCSKDGAFLLQLRYTRDRNGRAKIRAARQFGGSWQEVGDHIACPLCQRTLEPDLTLRSSAFPILNLDAAAEP